MLSGEFINSVTLAFFISRVIFLTFISWIFGGNIWNFLVNSSRKDVSVPLILIPEPNPQASLSHILLSQTFFSIRRFWSQISEAFHTIQRQIPLFQKQNYTPALLQSLLLSWQALLLSRKHLKDMCLNLLQALFLHQSGIHIRHHNGKTLQHYQHWEDTHQKIVCINDRAMYHMKDKICS